MTDRKTVMSWLEGLTQDDWPEWHSDSEVQETAKAALELLKDQPEIVRCKDCKHWVDNGADIDELPYWLPCKGQMRRPDYFCADGEKAVK